MGAPAAGPHRATLTGRTPEGETITHGLVADVFAVLDAHGHRRGGDAAVGRALGTLYQLTRDYGGHREQPAEGPSGGAPLLDRTHHARMRLLGVAPGARRVDLSPAERVTLEHAAREAAILVDWTRSVSGNPGHHSDLADRLGDWAAAAAAADEAGGS